MRPTLLATLLCLLPLAAVAAPSSAQQAAPSAVSSLRGELQKAEATSAPELAQRQALEREVARIATQIEAEKKKPAGVRRDLDLQTLLAASKSKTDELDRLRLALRGREQSIIELRRRLVAAIDVALASTSLGESARLELERTRTAQVAQLASPVQPLQIASESQDALDGPRELRYKADLLRDSGDKLRREAQRIATRIDSVERRRKLRERAGAIDEDMFGESTSNRHVARAQGTTDATASSSDKAAGSPQTPVTGSATTASPAGSQTLSPPSNSGASFGQTSSTTAVASHESTVLRNLVDPQTLDELRRADAIDDVERQNRALKKAQTELEQLAAELDRRAKALEGRADDLKKQK